MKRIKQLLLLLLSSLLGAGSSWAYPDKPVRVIIPFSPGGPSDVIGRLFADHLRSALGATVIVENRPGAGTSIGTAAVAKSEPDGHTMIIVSTMTLTSLPFLRKSLPYDVEKELRMVNYFTSTPMVMLVNPSFPAKNVAEFVAYAKQHPGKVNFGSSGNGQAYHLAAELLRLRTGIDINHVPYKGSAPTLTDLVGGSLHMAFDAASAPLGFVANQQLRALALTGKQRIKQLPGVPTMEEEGIKDYDLELNWGVFIQRQTPEAVARRLHDAITDITRKPDVAAALDKLALRPNSCPSLQACDQAMRAEMSLIGDLTRKIGLEPM